MAAPRSKGNAFPCRNPGTLGPMVQSASLPCPDPLWGPFRAPRLSPRSARPEHPARRALGPTCTKPDDEAGSDKRLCIRPAPVLPDREKGESPGRQAFCAGNCQGALPPPQISAQINGARNNGAAACKRLQQAALARNIFLFQNIRLNSYRRSSLRNHEEMASGFRIKFYEFWIKCRIMSRTLTILREMIDSLTTNGCCLGGKCRALPWGGVAGARSQMLRHSLRRTAVALVRQL